MDNMEFSTGGEFSSDRFVIEKRKRSKRQRPSPPSCAAAFRVAAITSSYSSGSGGGGGSNCYSNNDLLSPSISIDWTTEVEEEMVDCLMLLAKGISPMDELRKAGHRSTNSDVAVSVAGKDDGYVVYECKTCYRTFPSFQALGGHSASHKRAKLTENTERSLVLLPPLINTDEEEVREARNHTKFILSPLPLQVVPAGKGKAKVHECSICGTEFMSGQALGGHMRRHRTTMITPAPAALNPSSSSPPRAQITTNINSTEQLVENQSRMLMFDLNLPAPEDEHRSSNSGYVTISRGIKFLPIFE